jgi:hypothetical protein
MSGVGTLPGATSVYHSQKRTLPQDGNKDQKGASQAVFLMVETNNSRKQNPCQRKETFGSY